MEQAGQMKQADEKKGSLTWGFLAELVVVAVILAVMVFGLMPRFLKSRERIHEGEDIQKIQQVRVAVEGYYAPIEDDITYTVTFSHKSGAVEQESQKLIESLGINPDDTKLESSKWGEVTLTYRTLERAWTISYANSRDESGEKAPFYELSESLGIARTDAPAADGQQ